MAIPIPESRWWRFWKSDAPWDFLSVAAGLGPGAAAAYKFFTTDPAIDPNAYIWGWIVAGGVIIAGLSQAGKAIRKMLLDSSSRSTHQLAGCLHTLNGVLLADSDQKTVGLRSTVHVPDGKDLVQALDYIGDQRRKNALGRRTPMSCGAIGRVYRGGKGDCAARTTDNYEDFLQQMINSYGFNMDQARALDHTTQAWMAVSLVDQKNGQIDGVLYCDSQDRAFFTDDRQRAIVFASVGIAFFVGLRYH